jgi:mono/diheme cytochrome c family protein
MSVIAMTRALVAGVVVLWLGVPPLLLLALPQQAPPRQALPQAPQQTAPPPPPSQQTPLLTPEQIATLPAPANRPIDFTREIRPILQASCVKCHGRGRSKGGFSLETRASLLEGGDNGPAIVPGTSQASHLIALVAGLDPDNVMPQKGSRLKPEQIGLLRAWIDQGAAWDPAVNFARSEPRNIDPRQPPLPDALVPAHPIGEGNPIDRLLAPYFAEHHVTPGPLVDDRQFARRVSLDAVGLLPSPDALRAFVADRTPDKRDRLVARLLGDRRRYAEHWLSFWNDALRNDYRGPGFIDGGRQQISNWLYAALFENLPYDRFVAQLINPAPGAEGFTKGIIWRGVVNASQTPPMQAAQNVSQVFMGVNLKCASCHDSFINDWQLADAYGLAGIYADAPLEMVECDRPTGRTAPAKFLYAKLGSIDAKAARANRLQQLASVITGRQNGRLSRTIVNRLWARFMGRGLVEPVDDMEQPAWNADVLDWLAEDLVAHGYDLKHTMTRILTSRAYQLGAVDPASSGAVPSGAPASGAASSSAAAGSASHHDAAAGGAPAAGGPAAGASSGSGYAASADAPVFRGPAIRRLSAEQFADAIGAVTGVWQGLPAGDIDFSSALGSAVPAMQARWIWRSSASGAEDESAVTFRTTFPLASVPASARALVAYDGPFVLSVNGQKVSEVKGTAGPSSIDIRSALRPGQNVLTLIANHRPAPAPTPASAPAQASASAQTPPASASSPALAPASALASASTSTAASAAPAAAPPASKDVVKPSAGVLIELLVRQRADIDAPAIAMAGSGRTWQWAPSPSPSVAADRGWLPAVDRGDADTAPPGTVKALHRAIAAATLDGRARAALVTADPLTLALGRPNREQVVTSRQTAATTLQALELANGATLTRTLQSGAERLLADKPTRAVLVTRVYQRALGRNPTASETKVCLDLLGPTLRPEGVQDLLWSIAMLPEFQLIY